MVELTFHTLTCKDRVERFIAIRLKMAIAYTITKVSVAVAPKTNAVTFICWVLLGLVLFSLLAIHPLFFVITWS